MPLGGAFWHSLSMHIDSSGTNRALFVPDSNQNEVPSTYRAVYEPERTETVLAEDQNEIASPEEAGYFRLTPRLSVSI